jgi:hypothetical protein
MEMTSTPSPEPATERQAGEKFVAFALAQVEVARQKLPAIAEVAETAADRIVFRNGELLSAGDEGFSTTPTWRAGGICFSKRYDPNAPIWGSPVSQKPLEEGEAYYRTLDFETHYVVRNATSNDVVLLGFENEKQETLRLAQYVQQLTNVGAATILFASARTAQEIQAQFGRQPSLIPITNEVADGGVIEIPGWPERVCSGRSFVQRLYLWVFEAELIGAFLRRGKIPGVLLSVTYESPQIYNVPLINSYRFIPSFNITPLERGILGQTYLDHLRSIFSSIVPAQRGKILKASQWLAEAVRMHRKAYALLIHGITPANLPGDPNLFEVCTEGNAYYPALRKAGPGEVALHVGYNWYPSDLVNMVDQAGARLVLCATLVQDLPPRPVIYGEGGPMLHFVSEEQVPKRDNHIFINTKFSQYDATLKIPGYPVLAIPTSDLTDNMVYQMFVANVVELLAKN